ncbi:two-component sensor histidine kinase [Microlunatus endophyticus]|uniref:Two-component sensor histidine kinase n=1 Tax=Microlunatus endophyticus TaxID=1716077 RepID=A0A917SER8_9ACTN|nr:sensor histidine kinase [Microlunatus endophyticus]GGL77278.1 two-component sensor histidine kinase [Microlunatus endophyticus]
MASFARRLLYAGTFADGEDPNAAPVAHCDPNAAPRFTWRRAIQNMFWTYLIGLVFMPYALIDIGSRQPDVWVLSLRIGLAIAICLAYLATSWMADTGLVTRWCYLVGFVLLAALTAEFNGWDWVSYGAYVSMVIVSLIPWRTARWVLTGWNLALMALSLVLWNATPAVIAGIGMFIGVATGVAIESGRLRRHLDRAEQRVSTLAVAAERERIARDLHDILGHSLTAISIKSGLAARLAEVDPAAAREQMVEVERIARVALGDVRATASGLRQVRLATEIASARSVLLAAGVESVVPSAIPVLPDKDSELLGYAVREAVTNVVRHAEASRVMITIEDRAVAISDDGVGMPSGRTDGSGLNGLRRRITEAGGSFSVTAAQPRGTVVRALLKPETARAVETAGAAERVEAEFVEPTPHRVEGQPA